MLSCLHQDEYINFVHKPVNFHKVHIAFSSYGNFFYFYFGKGQKDTFSINTFKIAIHNFCEIYRPLILMSHLRLQDSYTKSYKDLFSFY